MSMIRQIGVPGGVTVTRKRKMFGDILHTWRRLLDAGKSGFLRGRRNSSKSC